MPALMRGEGSGAWDLPCGCVLALLPISAVAMALGAHEPILFVAFLVAGLAVVSATATLNTNKRFAKLRDAREGKSICTFARSLNPRQTDTWILRGVYEGLQATIPVRDFRTFPVLPSDDTDLFVDGEDLEDLITEIARRIGRSAKGFESNPMFGRVTTARDVVRLLEHQPRIRI